MAIAYEINPPKVHKDGFSPEEVGVLLEKTVRRVSEIAEFCDGVHVTESVLGTKRLSPVTTGRVLKKLHPELKITVSMRVIDKNIGEVERYVRDAIAANLDGILVLKGDPSQDDPADSGLAPSQVLRYLHGRDYGGRISLFLSIHNNPDFGKIKRKVDARPAGFVTQVIHSAKQASRICDQLRPKGFQVVPIVLLPSEKNAKSAEFLKLDWSGYKDRIGEFICEVHQIAGNVLITSPNDFGLAKQVLGNL